MHMNQSALLRRVICSSLLVTTGLALISCSGNDSIFTPFRPQFGSFYGFQNQLQISQERDSAALREAKKELELAERSKDFDAHLSHLQTRARHFRLNLNYAAAELLYRRIVKQFESSKNISPDKQAIILTELGTVDLHVSSRETASKHFLQALKIRESLYKKNHPLLLDSYADVANIYELQGLRDKSEYYRQKIGLPIGEARWSGRADRSQKQLPPDALYQAAKSESNHADAEKLYKRLVAIEFDIYGGCKGRVIGDLLEYKTLLVSSGKAKEAAALEVLLNNRDRVSKADLRNYMIDPPDSRDFVYHPILHSKAGHSLVNSEISDAIFRQLMGSVLPYSLMLSTQSEYFQTAETEAAQQFATRVKGLNRNEILTLFGIPVYQGGTVDCWSCSKPGEDIWIYRLGDLEVPVRLIFRGQKCIESAVCTSSDDTEFAEWRAGEIEKFAVGKSATEIEARFGTPPYLEKYRAEKKPKKIDNGYEPLEYRTGMSTLVVLEMRRGICTDATIGWLAH
ncbi:MAG: tetratricopeptide repeat protein [Candidatus Obscuribacterales bacterium]